MFNIRYNEIHFLLGTFAMRRFLGMVFLLLTVSLAGCSVYHLDVEQGNIITPDRMKQLRLGMTKLQVQETLGSPVLDNVLNGDCWYYVYTFQKGSSKQMIRKNLVVCFSNDRVNQVIDHYPLTPALVPRSPKH